MAKTVSEGFEVLRGWITPTETETTKAASHRTSIEACLKANFGMTNFFRAGSFGHGTSVSGYSDVDYFAVIPSGNLANDSAVALRNVKDVLAARFPQTGVYVDSPAVAVPFGTEAWERHEITPAYFKQTTSGFNVYGMPNRYGKWMLSSPTGLNSYTNTQNDRLSKKAKQVVRFVKAWNYYSGAGIRSIYIELRVAQYLSTEASVVYPIDVKGALRHMSTKGLAAMRDPLGLGADIYPCTDPVKPTALSKLNTALTRAEKACAADAAGNPREALEWWDKVYSGSFPGYY